MDKLIKVGHKFMKEYHLLKRSKKDLTTLNSTDIYTELKSSIDSLDVDSTFKFNDTIHFPPSSSLGFSSLHKDDHMQIGIFYVTKLHKMPLHDHPDMFVFTKALHGSAKLSLFTLPEKIDRVKQFAYPINFYFNERFDKSREVTVQAQLSENHTEMKKGDKSLVIEPVQNNLHEMIAQENFAFLDVILPKYDMDNMDDAELRFCNFYITKRIIDMQTRMYELKMQTFPEKYDIQEVDSPLKVPFKI